MKKQEEEEDDERIKARIKGIDCKERRRRALKMTKVRDSLSREQKGNFISLHCHKDDVCRMK
jgi:hypothetical protein